MNNFSTIKNTIYLSNDLKKDTIPDILTQINKFIKNNKQFAIVIIDLSQITSIDSAGVAFITQADRLLSTKISVDFINYPDFVDKAISSFSSPDITTTQSQLKYNFFETFGEMAIQIKEHVMFFLYLTADIFYWSCIDIFQKKGQRKGSFTQQSVIIGVNALLIVGLISFLIGLILALQSAAQLRQFGANIFIADLIGIAMLREMGPIMTAIVISGRSGSAIASEIATMVVTEEIDALKTMALNPVRYVIVPKFHAITITMPLLTILADLLGIFGGLIIGITYLQLSATAFFNELLTVVILKDILTGLFKSIIFAWIIVIIGCYNGLQVQGGAEGVGKATTASVVMSIFMVIIADSILGLIFYF